MTEVGKLRIAAIPGDSIGTEVTAEVPRAFRAAISKSDTAEYDLGSRRYLCNGELFTDADLNSPCERDAILLGAIGDPANVPPGVLERGLLLKMRFTLDHHVNLRPSKFFLGIESPLENPGKVDFVVVHEEIEGAYTGNGGVIRASTPHETISETSVNTRFGAEYVVCHTFELAMTRRKKLALVHKTSVLVRGDGMWQCTVNRVVKEYPGVDVDYLYIDAATIYLVTNSSRFDVIITDNLFGDIIADGAGAVPGGIGLAASGNINASNTNSSMLGPAHGSAPDIVDKGIANPTATILSGATVLCHLRREQDAQYIEAAVEADMATRDSGPIKITKVGSRIATTLK